MMNKFTLYVATFAAGAGASFARADELKDRLRQLAAQYQLVQTVDMRAICETMCNPSVVNARLSSHQEYDTRFAYTADGNKFNLITDSDPTVAANARFRIAYDGNNFQFLNLLVHHMAIQKAEKDFLPLFFPNPFYAPIAFISKVDEHDMFCPVKLREAKNPSAFDALIQAVKPVGDTTKLVGEFPLGMLGKKAIFGRIHFPAHGYLPTQLERSFTDGNKIDVADFEKYEEVHIDDHSFFYPVSIHRLQYSANHNRIYSESHLHVTKCIVNETVKADQFTIDFNLASQVVDRDSGQWLKQEDRNIRETALAHAPSPFQSGIVDSPARDEQRPRRTAPLAEADRRDSFYRWLGVTIILALLTLVSCYVVLQRKAPK